jgi:hypothetical protein
MSVTIWSAGSPPPAPPPVRDAVLQVPVTQPHRIEAELLGELNDLERRFVPGKGILFVEESEG